MTSLSTSSEGLEQKETISKATSRPHKKRTHKQRRWHAWSRPTLLGVLIALAGCALVLVGAAYGSDVFVTTGVALLLAFLFEGIVGAMTHAMFAFRRAHPSKKYAGLDGLHFGLARFLIPRRIALAQTWNQLDQNGDVIRKFTGIPPHIRGVFHSGGRLVRWRGAWGLWLNADHGGGEEDITHALGSEKGTQAVELSTDSRIPQSLGPYEDDIALSARPYVPGDPEHQISWTMSAHQGRMMTRVADTHQRPQLLVILDTLLPTEDPTLTQVDFEGLVRYAGGFDTSLTRSESVTMFTDGYADAPSGSSTERFLAAVNPSSVGSAQERAQHIDDLLNEPNTHGLFITLDSRSQGSLEASLQDLGALRHCDIVRIEPGSYAMDEDELFAEEDQFTETDATAETQEEQMDGLPLPETSGGPVQRFFKRLKARIAKRRAFWTKQTSKPSRTSVVTSRLVGTLAMECAVVGSLVMVRAFFGSQYWLPVSAVCAGVVIAEVGLIRTHGRTSALRALGMVCGVLVTGVVSITVVLHNATQVWWFNPTAGVRFSVNHYVSSGSSNGRLAAATLNDWGSGSVGGALSSIAGRASDALFVERFPVPDDVYTDVALLAFISVALCLLRIVLTFVHMRWICAILPIAVMAAQYSAFGTHQSAIVIVVSILSGLLLLWFSQDKTVDFPAPAVLGSAAAAIALVLTPVTSAVVSEWDLPFGNHRGLFSSTSLNPLVDLSQSLKSNSSAVALTYFTSNDRPVYIRIATLDDFRGETWTFGSDADPANRQATTDDGVAPGGYTNQTDFTDGSPLQQYEKNLLNSSGYDYGNRGFVSASRIWIQTLSSRFRPVVGLPGSVSPSTAQWKWSRDATSYSQTDRVESGTTYNSIGTYIQPMSTASDLSYISRVMRYQLNPQSTQRNATSNEYYRGGYSQRENYNNFKLDDQAAQESNTYARQNYTDLPKKLPKSVNQVVKEANEGGISADVSSTPDEQTKALEFLLNYFQNGHFTYSLNVPDGGNGGNMDMIGTFLTRKSGYCVHYATSFAVLARALGVPTRVVMGYLPSSNTEKGRYSVTNQQLHAWTEAYVTGIGWLPFDVTPADTSENGSSNQGAKNQSVQNQNQSNNSNKQDTQQDQKQDQKAPQQPSNQSDQNTENQDTSGISDGVRGGLIAVAMVVLVALVVLSPYLIRRRRTQTRLKSIAAQMTPNSRLDTPPTGEVLDARSIENAWTEIIDTMRDCGIHLPGTATEHRISQMVEELSSERATKPNTESELSIDTLASMVAALRYGGHASSDRAYGGNTSLTPAQLLETVKRTHEVLLRSQRIPRSIGTASQVGMRSAIEWKVRRIHNALRRLRRALLPASLFSRTDAKRKTGKNESAQRS